MEKIKQLEAEAAKSKTQLLMMEAEARNSRASQEGHLVERHRDERTIQQMRQQLTSLASENDAKVG